ncbi:response regulator transcription factor [Psychrosphaera sp. B3R10]|uniref:response regulator n=1 Tax=unclassified Psychrosphaera TaxID=2641570 RepID=UPI001C0A567D|nr:MULTISPECIES: response regulator transcription factor [unclassified Psychrosphaera]MBU2882950.1 response regulator transcription factor [Psychrosphaera sp. I2R16]MBU2991347.1 response regulator transcription factor [Psychrosphaera sp. B3R10]MDO6720236.1 response regulator transcription factor [Psychrosphaera sp. 1_MG-2023]
MEKYTILFADDHTLIRQGIISLVRHFAFIDSDNILQASNGLEAIAIVKRAHPDVVVMDVSMPQMNGLEATQLIKSQFPEVKVLILSHYNNEPYVLRALKAGADGYMLKDAAVSELEQGLLNVLHDKLYISPDIDQNIIAKLNNSPNGLNDALELLTARQRNILQLIAEGHSTKDIAEKLFLSVKTIEAHRSNIMDRLAIRDIPGLVRFAIRVGLIQA